MIQKRPLFVIALCSLLWALCYPPFPFGLLSFVVLAPAFWATTALTPRRAFGTWFLGGLVYNTVMYWWIYNVMKVGPAFVIGGGLVLLIVFLSLFNGLMGLGFQCASRHRWLLVTYPIAWAGLEALRAVGEMSFPWNNLGYTLGHFPALIQSASSGGIYGLSAMVVIANLFFFQAFRTRRWIFALAGLGVPLILCVHGMAIMHHAETFNNAPSMNISLVQPSIPQTKKWSEQYFGEVMAKTFRTMDGPQGDLSPVRGSQLVVLAETAVPEFLRSRPELIDSFTFRAHRLRAELLVGALDVVRDPKPWSEYRFYNSAFLFHPDTASVEQYSKRRLVPFSEKLPFDKIFPILNYVNLGEGDFSPGDGYRVWGNSVHYSPSICYEVIYPSFAREAKVAGANFLVNITNDGWFGRTNGPYQHANIARFRAVESGMPIARCSNTGVSVFYDAWGRDLGHTELMDSTVLQRALPIPHRDTFYAVEGGKVDAFFLSGLAIWVLASCAAGVRRTS
jgi:apolipoprotein N-acyltransferase